MRNKPASAMQKTYDDCFLICSTAVYFESQNNEAEALRSWRNALDQIHYHNAYRMPANYHPRTETEKALYDSLRQLELQCKERVDLLEALKRSRAEAKAQSQPNTQVTGSEATSSNSCQAVEAGLETPGWLGQGTVPPVTYPDLSRPPLPPRPSPAARTSSWDGPRRSYPQPQPVELPPVTLPTLALSATQTTSTRSPSPDKRGRMLRTLRSSKENPKHTSTTLLKSLRSRQPAATKAATQAWGSTLQASFGRPSWPLTASSHRSEGTLSLGSGDAEAASRFLLERRSSSDHTDQYMRRLQSNSPGTSNSNDPGVNLPADFARAKALASSRRSSASQIEQERERRSEMQDQSSLQNGKQSRVLKSSPRPPSAEAKPLPERPRSPVGSTTPESGYIPYRKEYSVPHVEAKKPSVPVAIRVDQRLSRNESPNTPGDHDDTNLGVSRTRREVQASPRANTSFCQVDPDSSSSRQAYETREVSAKTPASGRDESVNNVSSTPSLGRQNEKPKGEVLREGLPLTPTSDTPSTTDDEDDTATKEWKARVDHVMKNLPKGVDETAAKQIFNDIVVHADEVRWEDVAGLDVAKAALKETVVYPFLRPDLFMGLREPARGMLLFGPPGTGKTMLARAVATESKSTFFAISASSLTSKWLGESEKLVRALFQIARALAPSIIFVDEIDSLLSTRSSSGEHETSRRIKTEFLIQWSDLARAAAGREQSEKEKAKGDASRVLVLAATNLPWAIDEAARRRFVRRQYIPLPEAPVRRQQLETLMSHQKHSLSEEDFGKLVELTDGFSGSDITALAKDAAMGPLRSLGEMLLHMTMDEIRPIQIEDFQASLQTIRPSVSKQGLKKFENWAKEFGERGG